MMKAHCPFFSGSGRLTNHDAEWEGVGEGGGGRVWARKLNMVVKGTMWTQMSQILFTFMPDKMLNAALI